METMLCMFVQCVLLLMVLEPSFINWYVFVCICVCMICMGLYTHIYANVCACVSRHQRLTFSTTLQLPFLNMGCLTEPGALWCGQAGWPLNFMDLPVSLSSMMGLQRHLTMPDLNEVLIHTWQAFYLKLSLRPRLEFHLSI